MAAIVSAKCPAPPSARSSRSTEVTTTCARPSFAVASATFSGSSGSSAPGMPVLHVAEGAGAGAGVAHDHEGGVVLRPALADVRAARLLADRDQAVLAHDRRRLAIDRRARRLDADPVGLARRSACPADAPSRDGAVRARSACRGQRPFGLDPLGDKNSPNAQKHIVVYGRADHCRRRIPPRRLAMPPGLQMKPLKHWANRF